MGAVPSPGGGICNKLLSSLPAGVSICIRIRLRIRIDSYEYECVLKPIYSFYDYVKYVCCIHFRINDKKCIYLIFLLYVNAILNFKSSSSNKWTWSNWNSQLTAISYLNLNLLLFMDFHRNLAFANLKLPIYYKTHLIQMVIQKLN